MPWDKKEYPEHWDEIRARILIRADHRCEGSPKYPDCRAENHKPHPVTGSKVILTIAHMDHSKGDDETKMKALCQKCHLGHDQKHHAANRKYGRNHKKANFKLDL